MPPSSDGLSKLSARRGSLIDFHPLPILALVLVLVVKTALLVIYAPFELAQNAFTTLAGDKLLTEFDWLLDADVEGNPRPLTFWRPIGYGMIAAIAKAIAGQYWVWLVLTVQSLLGVCAGLFVYQLVRALGFGIVLSTVAFFLYACSMPLSNDLILLADSLSASLTTIAVCAFATRFVDDPAPPLGFLLWSGVLVMGCFLLRDSMLYPSVVLALVLGGMMMLATGAVGQPLLRSAVFICPLLVAFVVIVGWNYMRTGHPITSTGGQHAYLNAVLKTAKLEPNVFGTDSLLDRVTRNEELVDHDDHDTGRINLELAKDHGLSAIELNAMMKRKYIWTMENYPRAFLRAYARRLDPRRQEPVLGNPFRNIDELDFWREAAGGEPYWTQTRTGVQRFYETRDFSVVDARTGISLFPRLGFRVLDMVLLVAFLVALPVLSVWHVFRSSSPKQRRVWLALAGFWAFYVSTLLIYAFIEVKSRYLSTVSFAAIVGALATTNELWHQGHALWRRRAKLDGKSYIQTD